MENAEYQLDRVAGKWAADTKRDPARVRGDLFGEKMVDVLQFNLQLRRRYGAPAD